ncbi:MAG: hypothetical protein QMC89_02785 [Candidatus Hodarchaeaceae archaeon]|nr:hypothetical protein [Candidatus Hodarchaeaceae archaeon]
MKVASAFVPGHISGFFQICDEAKEFERRGSRNCGPCIDAGVLTEVKVEPAGRSSVDVLINAERAPEALTTFEAVQQILRMVSKPLRITVSHSSQVPIGAGYGASGAGALGAVLALSEALGLGLARQRLVAIAHVAEVKCSTGLGDVGAQSLGGLVVGLEPGAPPHGRWSQISTPKNIKVICGTLGQLSTRELLHDDVLRKRSKEFGGLALRKLVEKPTLQNFMSVSREFAEALGLLDDELHALLKTVLSADVMGASMVMLGRAVFALVKGEKLERARRAFLEFLEPSAVMSANLDFSGARLVDRKHFYEQFFRAES